MVKMGQTIIGIKRKEQFSPNHITNDARILTQTANELQKMGLNCHIVDETDVERGISLDSDMIFSMARGKDAVNRLTGFEKKGVTVINSSKAVFNCYRVNMVKYLQDAGVNFPLSKVVKTTDENLTYGMRTFGSRKIWIKRGDVHALHREDVSLVYSDEELANLLKEFSNRGMEHVVLQKHIDGDTVKFYSVKDTPFFFWYYLNGVNHTTFNVETLKDYANKSAGVMDLIIYGGDAIISPDGTISIIDINDWPSFAPVRDEASIYISKLISKKLVEISQLQN